MSRKHLFKCEEIVITEKATRYAFTIYESDKRTIVSQSYTYLVENAKPNTTYHLGCFYELVSIDLPREEPND